MLHCWIEVLIALFTRPASALNSSLTLYSCVSVSACVLVYKMSAPKGPLGQQLHKLLPYI